MRAPTEGDDGGPDTSAADEQVSRALDAVLARFTVAARTLARRAGLGADDLGDLLQEVCIRLSRALRTPEKIREAACSPSPSRRPPRRPRVPRSRRSTRTTSARTRTTSP